MPFYAAPGVYVEEVASGARPIGTVPTSIAAFVGVAPKRDAHLGEAVAVTNWTEFCTEFAPEGSQSTDLFNAVLGFFSNGGGLCYIVNVAEGEYIGGGGPERSGLQLLESIDEVAIVAAPGYADARSYEALLTHCENLEDRVAILDPPRHVPRLQALTRVATGALPPARDADSEEASDEDTATTPPSGGAATEGEDSTGTTGERTPARAGGPPATRSGREGDAEDEGVLPRESSYGALYFPYVKVYDPLARAETFVPPSGHMAGVWARTDFTRGVHKAPANEVLRGVTDLSYRVTRQEQELLNPKGVNCIRSFPTAGIRVWGARTRAAEADDFRYINVRRLFCMLKESIAEGTNWIVFEPNDYRLSAQIRRELNSFLTRVWADGALFGRTPQEAFFVKCDPETNPAHMRDAGYVTAVIGVAPVKPAEFVVFKLSQSTAGSEIQSLGA